MTEGNRTSIGYRQHLHPRNNNNNNRVTQMQVTTLDTDNHLLDNSVQVEDNTRNPAEGGEVVGYIQGFGPVTAEPNMSAAVIRGKKFENILKVGLTDYYMLAEVTRVTNCYFFVSNLKCFKTQEYTKIGQFVHLHHVILHLQTQGRETDFITGLKER